MGQVTFWTRIVKGGWREGGKERGKEGRNRKEEGGDLLNTTIEGRDGREERGEKGSRGHTSYPQVLEQGIIS